MSPRGKRDPGTPFLSRTEVLAERTAAEIQEILMKMRHGINLQNKSLPPLRMLLPVMER
jgi:hypothetical protein